MMLQFLLWLLRLPGAGEGLLLHLACKKLDYEVALGLT